jgi:Protein of unknown function (DUF1501)
MALNSPAPFSPVHFSDISNDMLVIPGKPKTNCDGLSRREWLTVGGVGAFGLADLLAGRESARLNAGADARTQVVTKDSELPRSRFGRARSCIVLFMFGAPAHQDLWDLKPLAPAEVRGEFQPIPSSVPGLQLGEHIPRLAQRADRYAIVRSVTHPDNTHTVAMHYMLSGIRHVRPATNPQNAPDDFPCFGAVLNHVTSRGGRRRKNEREGGLPAAVSLNAPANQVSANNHIFPGFFAGFLGNRFDPLFVPQNSNVEGLSPLPAVENPERLVARRGLLESFERQTRRLESTAAVRGLAGEYDKAFRALLSPATRQAFELQNEPGDLRRAYGNTPFGQGCLLARRLVERGVSLVTVNWERDDAFWDTHKNNFVDMKTKLCPNLDQGFAALLDDMQQRGLLDETLIVMLGEFGRTPTINAAAGRDHWAACNSVVLAGAGITGGAVYGASDRLAAYPSADPVTPEDLAATMYHLLGVDPELMLFDPAGRPYPLTTGTPIWGLL